MHLSPKNNLVKINVHKIFLDTHEHQIKFSGTGKIQFIKKISKAATYHGNSLKDFG